VEPETIPLQSNAENAEAKTCDGRNEKSSAKKKKTSTKQLALKTAPTSFMLDF
jgi:hypothetical protein